MASYKVKGFFKGFKVISRIFVVKEHEMEIGYPTDVKHVAHIGWDSAPGNASPSWMKNIMASPDLSSLGNFAASPGTSWASQDLDRQPPGTTPASGGVAESSGRQDSAACADVPRPPRKTRGKKPEDGAATAPSRSTDELASPPPAAADEDETAVGVAANSAQ